MQDLSANQKIALTDLFGQLCPSLSLAMAEQLNREVLMEAPAAESVPVAELQSDPELVLHTAFNLSAPLSAESVFYVPDEAARTFADLIAGGDGLQPAETLGDVELEGLNRAMAGFARGLAMALTNITGELVEVEHSVAHLGPLAVPPVFAMAAHGVRIRIGLTLEGILDTELCFVFPPELALLLAPESESPADGGGDMLSEEDLAAMFSDLSGAAPTTSMAAPKPSAPQLSSAYGNGPISRSDQAVPRGIELIIDIPLEVTVELGRMRMLIKDILELTSGSIVELDRVAGEPVDLLVNGRLVAKGEVVVIEDNFGIRITEIVSPADRVAGLGKGR